MKFRIKQSFFLIDHKISEKLRKNKSERECKNTDSNRNIFEVEAERARNI